MPAETAWDHYKELEAFQGFGLTYALFETHLKAHRKQVKPYIEAMQREVLALQHDRVLNPAPAPRPSDQITALLRQDIAVNHSHEGLTPSQFRNTREEYKIMSLKKFKEKLYQEIRRVKFCNYLQKKREKQIAKAVF